jgi:hypothetical protein
MFHATLLCVAILGDGGKPAEPTQATQAAYETAQANAGKTAAAQIQLALWCEAHGLNAERIKHLNEAISRDSSNLLARGLLGLVAFQGKWAKPEQVEQGIQRDPEFQAAYHEYLARRVRIPQKDADAQLRLAAWCLEKGLNDEAMVHYYAVTRIDPSRDIAWLRLGYKKHKDRWVKPEDLAAQKLESERQKRADTIWKPRLEKLRDAMESTVETRRLKAERELYQITDPRAVPMIWKTFASGSESTQLLAVELLAQIDGPTASFYLVRLALEKPSPEVRTRACRALAHRDPRDVIGLLISLIHKPLRYEVKRGTGAGSVGVLLIEGEKFDLNRFYRMPTIDARLSPPTAIWLESNQFVGPKFTAAPAQAAQLFSITNGIQRGLAYQAGVLNLQAMEETQSRIDRLDRTLDSDIQTVEAVNAQIKQTNETALPLLETLTGQKLGADPEPWNKWWADQLGLVVDDRYSQPRSSRYDTVEEPDVQVELPVVAVRVELSHSCFGAGTLIRTMNGLRAIESIREGDRVLAQDTATGALAFKSVLATHRNGPAETFRIAIDGESIVTTGIHRFWKAGNGWTMARDLKPGDHLRMLDGIVTIQSVTSDAKQIVYNLTVAENRTFLVGTAGLLVHDFSFVQPVSEPFDRANIRAPSKSK